MILPTIRQVEMTFTRYLNGSHMRRFLREVCHIELLPADRARWENEQVDPDDLMQILLGDWLLHLDGVFSEAQIYQICRRLPEAWINDLLTAETDGETLPAFLVDVAERRWIIYTGLETIYDAVEGYNIDKLPRPAVTHIMFDATAAYMQAQVRWEQAHGRAGTKDCGSPFVGRRGDPTDSAGSQPCPAH